MPFNGTVGSPGSSMLSNILLQGRAPGAPIQRPTVPLPNRGDYGTPGSRPTITNPTRGDFGTASDAGIKEAATEAGSALRGFNDPTHTAAFRNLMNLSQEQTGTAAAEIDRESKDAASRAGFTGGFGARARAAGNDRLHALAEAGFAGAASIRDQQAGVYNTAEGALTSLLNTRNQEQGAGDRAFGSALASAHEHQGDLDLGFSKLVQERDLSWADAKSEAQRMQAQLDEAYNNSMIDNARYTQMSASLAAQLESERNRLAESKREFDLTRSDSLAAQRQAELEAARNRTSQGIDPVTGQRYGNANPAPGDMLSQVLKAAPSRR